MKFGTVPVADAVGAVLAHSVALADGRMRKGIVLGPDDVAALQAAGIQEVTVARLDPMDMGEDKSAHFIAKALNADTVGLRMTEPATGRVNLIATAPGIAVVDAEAVHKVNRVSPMITVATVPPYQRMDADGLVATIKIISYGVARELVTLAQMIGKGALGLAVPAVGQVELVETTVGSEVGDKGEAALQTRLERLGVGYTGRTVVGHRADALALALRNSTAEVICILTASATSDIADVGPAAVRAAGGVVHHFGMPVDPGNLLFLGEIDGRPVIGLPGCARSPALNGADWVLERVLCGVPVTSDDIAAMGVGGLLKEIPARGRPRRVDR